MTAAPAALVPAAKTQAVIAPVLRLRPGAAIARRHVLAAGGAALLPRRAAAQTVWQAVSAYPEGNFHTRNLRQFIDTVQQASGGRLRLELHSDATRLPMTEIRRAVQSGQVQLGEVLLSAYGQEDPLFDLDGIPHLVASYGQAERLAALARPMLETRFRRTGSTLLYTVPWPPAGFFGPRPVETLQGLGDYRLRTYNAATHRFALLVGARPLLVEAAGLRQAFADGVVDGMVTSAATGVDIGIWNFLRCFTQIGFAWPKNAVFLQSRALEALPEDLRGIVRSAAAAAEQRGWALSRAEHHGAEAMLAQHGMLLRPPTPALRQGLARISEVMVREWVARAGPQGRRLIDTFQAG